MEFNKTEVSDDNISEQVKKKIKRLDLIYTIFLIIALIVVPLIFFFSDLPDKTWFMFIVVFGSIGINIVVFCIKQSYKNSNKNK